MVIELARWALVLERVKETRLHMNVLFPFGIEPMLPFSKTVWP
jgi:hypothetical protein